MAKRPKPKDERRDPPLPDAREGAPESGHDFADYGDEGGGGGKQMVDDGHGERPHDLNGSPSDFPSSKPDAPKR